MNEQLNTRQIRELTLMGGPRDYDVAFLCDEVDRLRGQKADAVRRWAGAVEANVDLLDRAEKAEAKVEAVRRKATGRGEVDDPELNEWGLGYAQAMADVRAALDADA